MILLKLGPNFHAILCLVHVFTIFSDMINIYGDNLVQQFKKCIKIHIHILKYERSDFHKLFYQQFDHYKTLTIDKITMDHQIQTVKSVLHKTQSQCCTLVHPPLINFILLIKV